VSSHGIPLDLLDRLLIIRTLPYSEEEMVRTAHKVHICREYHSVCPLVGIGNLPPPLSPASVPLPRNQGGGGTRVRVRGWGSPNSNEKKLRTLPALWDSIAFYCQLVWILDHISSVLRIRDVYPGSDFFSISDPGCLKGAGSRIPISNTELTI
jgi:hypothetical protein